MKKCKYFNNAQTACCLMLDDLSLTATTLDGTLSPASDWGFGLNSDDSLYRYLENNLLRVYPEVKGTFFYPLGRHGAQNPNAGYALLFREADSDFKQFVHGIANHFDLAFHGIQHGRYVRAGDPSISGNMEFEFAWFTEDDYNPLRKELDVIEEQLEVRMTGGKYPGFTKNEHADSLVEQLGFKWWAVASPMMGRSGVVFRHYYSGSDKKVLALPTTLPGDCLSDRLFDRGRFGFLSRLIGPHLRKAKRESYIEYLYDQGYVISVQEHFQNQRTDGRRQTPNVYDDIDSLLGIFGFLRGADVWYATCSEVAHYLESYDYTDLLTGDDGSVILEYRGRWEKTLLSIVSDSREIENMDTGETMHGTYKAGCWIYNNIQPGTYREL